MDLALFFSAVALGLAGAPHCLAMCGSACTALGGAAGQGGGASFWGFHLARLASYSAAGAVAAASVGAMASLAAVAPALRPLWTLFHCAAMGLGLYLLWRGQQPEWMERMGRNTGRYAPDARGWQRMVGPTKSVAAGAFWVAWPCGLLQSALLVASLSNHAWSGAAVMGGFALASGITLALGPALWLWLGRQRGGAVTAVQWQTLAVRGAGAVLAAASAWALGHDLFTRLVDYCFS